MKPRKWFSVATALLLVLLFSPLEATAATSAPTAVASPWGPTSVSSGARSFCVDSSGNAFVVQQDAGATGTVFKATSSGVLTTLDDQDAALNNATAIGCSGSTLYLGVASGDIYSLPMGGGTTTSISTGNTFIPGGIIVASGTIYISASDAAAIFTLPLTGGGSATNSGITGLASNGMSYMALSGSTLFVVGSTTNELFQAPLGGGAAHLVPSAELNEPAGVALDPGGNIWIANLNANNFVFVNSSQTESVVVAPSGDLAQGPGGLFWSDGRLLTQNVNQADQPFLSAAVTAPPSAPLNVALSVSSSTVTISWSTPSWDGNLPITGYSVTADPGGATCTTTQLSCQISGLTPGAIYSFTVTASNADGVGPPSSPPVSIKVPVAIASTGSPLGSELQWGFVLVLLGSAVILGRRYAQR